MSLKVSFLGALRIFEVQTDAMNTQDIINPVAQFIEWTFQTVLLPISDGANWGVIALGGAGLVFWLRLQSKYNSRAKKDGTLM